MENGRARKPSIYAPWRVLRAFKARARAVSVKTPQIFVKQEFSEELRLRKTQETQAECAFLSIFMKVVKYLSQSGKKAVLLLSRPDPAGNYFS